MEWNHRLLHYFRHTQEMSRGGVKGGEGDKDGPYLIGRQRGRLQMRSAWVDEIPPFLWLIFS